MAVLGGGTVDSGLAGELVQANRNKTIVMVVIVKIILRFMVFSFLKYPKYPHGYLLWEGKIKTKPILGMVSPRWKPVPYA